MFAVKRQLPDRVPHIVEGQVRGIQQMLREVGTSVLVPPSMIQVMLYG